MKIWVVRDSNCGNGHDDPGQVLAVFDSKEKAMKWVPEYSLPDVEVEGPFMLNNERFPEITRGETDDT